MADSGRNGYAWDGGDCADLVGGRAAGGGLATKWRSERGTPRGGWKWPPRGAWGEAGSWGSFVRLKAGLLTLDGGLLGIVRAD